MSEWVSRSRRRPISASNAAFAGFSLVRQRPTLFFGLMIAVILFGLVTTVLQFSIAGPALAKFMDMRVGQLSGEKPDPAQVMEVMGPIWELNLVMLPLTAAFYAVVNAAVYRAVLRPQDRGFAYLRLGWDELRQLGSIVLLWLTLIGAGILAGIATAILIVIGAVVAGLFTQGGDGGRGPLVALAVFLPMIALLAFFCALGVRLSLAGPMTFAQRRVRVTGSWTLTRGYFWPMFGAYLLAGILMLLAALAMLLLALGVAFVLGGVAAVRGLFVPDATSLTGLFTPERIIMMVLNAPIGALWFGIAAAIPAMLYVEIADATAPPDSDGRSHLFGAAPLAEPAAPTDDYPIVPPRDPPRGGDI